MSPEPAPSSAHAQHADAGSVVGADRLPGEPDEIGLQLLDELRHGFDDARLDENEIANRHAVMRIDVSGKRRQRAIRHPDGNGGHVFERVGHREQQNVHKPSVFVTSTLKDETSSSKLDLMRRAHSPATLASGLHFLTRF